MKIEYKVVVPPLGESVVEGTIVKWLKSEGDKIIIDDPIVEIMTDKINIEIPSPHNGIMIKHLIPINTVVQIGAEIGIMEIEGEAVDSKAFQVLPDGGVEKTLLEPDVKAPPKDFIGAVADNEQAGIHSDKDAIEAGLKAVKSSPIVRRLAREHFIDLRLVRGTGHEERISKNDILKYIDGRYELDKVKPGFIRPDVKTEEIIPITGVRKVIAEHMTKSAFTIPHVTTFDECDMSKLVAWRKEYVDEIEKKHGVRITYLPFIAKAIIFAAREFPWINATFE
ncbi:MAG: 2-oxo acid dehydrogenase subunit E2, partial [candidate division Zixibacteria bacterium]|nr:2-oxo acid dehydrogenase subunit E2 [candidate division Zixibacteria bacterium]